MIAKPTTDPDGAVDPAVIERFWAKVDVNGPVPEYAPELGNCWLWTGGLRSDRYGQYYAGPDRGRLAHRFSYEWHNGPITDPELQVDHLCRVKRCVRPAHLELVTHVVNTQRSGCGDENAGGAFMRSQTRCRNGHSYSGDNVRILPNGRRSCVTCARAKYERSKIRWTER